MTADGVITGWDAATNKCVPCASKPCVDCRDDYKVCKACLEQAPTPPQSDGDKPFYLTKDGKCEFCDKDGSKGCNTTVGCKEDGSCIECQDNFRLIGGKCVMCADGCNYALNAQNCDEQGQCTKCDDNWARTANGTCVPCPDFCDECDVADDGAVVCLSCFHQYTLNKDGSECLSCEDPNCYECPEGPAVCANCTLFALPNGTCAADAGIDGCSNTDSTGKACTQCFTGYALVDGKCKECNAGEGCEACAATSVTECVTCNEDGGYVLDAATKKCTTKCKDTWCDVCASPTAAECEACSSGWGLTSAGKCEQCKADNCAKCDGDLTKCQACMWAKRGTNALVDGRCVFFSYAEQDKWGS
ncbi:serine threonine [Chlorella sorokiniana]|uniref:Serine threonine n=1 Tax=Chlorella sorokiniana TaxID=3076 RepID=A0A2P6TXE5_CHLSO|nr:serine threonine [Chlorella sorokiniana]|eukprot:PRW58733.1 serine threonine [Chlorella sorokiniana]